MGTVLPIDLVRLRSATAAYVAILHDSLPRLERLQAPDTGPDPHDAELMARLRDSIEAALDIDDAPGTPAAILTTLCHLLGFGPPGAGVSAPTRPSSASEMQVHLADGIVDGGVDDAAGMRERATTANSRRQNGRREQALVQSPACVSGHRMAGAHASLYGGG